jgi:methionyl aminopeptidase
MMTPKTQVVIHTDSELDGIRRAAQATAYVLDKLCEGIHPGMTSLQIDAEAERLIRETGGRSAFLGYHGFPGQICISINDEVVHGIGKAERVVQTGDLVSLDVGVKLDGFIGDTARTVAAGGTPTTAQNKALLDTTRKALEAGIAKARMGNYINDISKAVEKVVLDAGFTVVRDFVGHGCGCELHEPPEVPNFQQKQRGPKLRPGMVLAIEPMVNAGTHRVKVDRLDGWTVTTADGEPSAHFEHMVLITRNKPEILTWPKTA